MVFEILIPEINIKPRNTKDAVISILTIEWPLTLRNIFYGIKKQYGYSFTYQSVYKAVKELCEKNVLRKKLKSYEINIDWVKKVQSFTDIIETNYYAKERVNYISGLDSHKSTENLMILNFKSLFDAEKYLYYFMKSELAKLKNQSVFYKTRYEWRPIFYLRAEYNYFTKLAKNGHKFYFSSSGKSYLEEISNKFYKSIGIKQNKVKDEISTGVLIFSDYFIQIFIPESVQNKIKKYLEEKSILLLLKTLDNNGPIKVVINKDAELAKEMKKQIFG